MAKTQYWMEVGNDELGEVRVIKGSSQSEVQAKAQQQLARWDQRVQRLREQQRIADSKQRADAMTDAAQAQLDEWRGILRSTLLVNDRIDWETLYDHRTFTPPPMEADPPTLDSVRSELGVPQASWIESIFASRREKRLALEAQADEEYERRKKAFEAYAKEFDDYVVKLRRRFEWEQAHHNQQIADLKVAYEAGDQEAVERYIDMVLERSSYPDGFDRDYDIEYRDKARTMVVDFQLPSPGALPRVVAYTYVKSRDSIEPRELGQRDFNRLYDDVVCQTTIRTIHEIFESDYARVIDFVVFNGWVETLDPATGNDTTIAIVSCQAGRGPFEQMDLSRVDAPRAVRGLRARLGNVLVDLKSVDPILRIQRRDRTLVNVGEALEGIHNVMNLADMDPSDFERLIGDLFNRIFAPEDGKVEVTGSSGDGGIDVLITIPSAIRGGKYAVQVKRYNGIVPPTAVRDLYGTVNSLI